MKKLITTIIIGIFAFAFIDIDNTKSLILGDSQGVKALKDANIKFSSDYKNIDISLELNSEVSTDMLINSIYIDSIVIQESSNSYDSIQNNNYHPKIVSIEERHDRKFDNIHVLVIVDLTLSQKQIEAQREAVRMLHRVSYNNNMHVAFSGDGTISETVPVTQYVLDNNFKKFNNENYLYRDIIKKNEEMLRSSKSNSTNESWSEIPNDRKLLFIFSNEETYRNDTPIDKDHFHLQQELVNIGSKADTVTSKNQFPIYYVSFASKNKARDINRMATKMRLEKLCESTGGRFCDDFDYEDIFANISHIQNIKNVAYDIKLENPDKKIYIGEMNDLNIKLFSKDSIFVESNLHYSIGTPYVPTTVNHNSTSGEILIGVLFILLIMIVTYFAMQLLYPHINYWYFKRKYITQYQGDMMVYDENIVEQHCHYCKDKFEKGDEIVVKCKHTTHLECWNENNYRCPEYGEECTTGAHYYNSENLFDPKNSPFMMIWVLTSIGVAILIWLTFLAISAIESSYMEYIYHNTLIWIDNLKIFDYNFGDKRYEYTYLSRYGFSVGLWITLALCFLSNMGLSFKRRAIKSLTLAAISGVCCAIVFFIYEIITTPVSLPQNAIPIHLMLWGSISGIIASFASYNTHIKFMTIFKGICITIAFGLIALEAAELYNHDRVNSFYIQPLFNTIYCLGFFISFVFITPRSKRYFLRVEGNIKPTDIALFKWFNSCNNKSHIYIGSSLDCDLQTSWDLSKGVKPIAATIIHERDNMYLIPNEDDIWFNGTMRRAEKRIRLYREDKFKIGGSTFTYIEKDKHTFRSKKSKNK